MTYGLDTSVIMCLVAQAMAALGTPEAWKASPGFVDRMIAGEYASKGYVTLSCEKSFRHLDFAEVIKGA